MLIHFIEANSQIMVNFETDFQHKHFTWSLVYVFKVPTETLDKLHPGSIKKKIATC